jgi:hypothetical protein
MSEDILYAFRPANSDRWVIFCYITMHLGLITVIEPGMHCEKIVRIFTIITWRIRSCSVELVGRRLHHTTPIWRFSIVASCSIKLGVIGICVR